MFKITSALLCALLVLSILGPTKCARGFGGRSGGFSRGGASRHSYPSSHGGLSGGHSSGSHGYPSSGGLSGSGGSHAYPSSGGLSGSGGSHGYPSSSGGLSGGSHGYPSSGTGLSGGARGYPSSSGSVSGGSHGYPSGGLSGSGSHGYPPSRGGLSGSGSSHGYPSSHTTKTTINNNYFYSPPQRVTYAGQNYPVYKGSAPTYVYEYKNSGSKYGTLLAGLALLNLGALAGTVYANSHGGSRQRYQPAPGEVCKFGVRRDNGDYEETKIDCNLITSFIYQEQPNTNVNNVGTNTTTVTTTVTNVTNTVVNSTTPVMLPNGTLVAETNLSPNGTQTSSSVTTVTTTVQNAVDVKGKEIAVTPGMQCYVIRTSPSSNMKKAVPCGLLQNYARQSLKPNSATRNLPTMIVLCAIAAFMNI